MPVALEQMLDDLKEPSKLTHKYVYVWVRKDLPHAYQIIQAGHALHEMGMDTMRPWFYDDPPKKTSETTSISVGTRKMPVHLILFGVKNEKELLEVSRYLNENTVEHHTFYEPDFDTGFTAIATELFDNNSERRSLFKRFRMY